MRPCDIECLPQNGDLNAALVEPNYNPVKEIHLANEVGDEAAAGLVIQRDGAAKLLDAPLVHDRDPVGHCQRLFLIMRHVDDRDAQAGVQRLDFDLKFFAQLLIEGTEWFIHQ